MFTDSINPWLDLILAVGAIVVMLSGLYRWANRSLERRIIAEIKEATYQIQPDSNGGKSLYDLHKKVDRLADEINMVKRSLVSLEGEVDQLENDVERLM